MKKEMINMHNIKALTVLLIIIVGCKYPLSAQIKIGENPKSINADAVLDVESSNKGILLPRIALSSTTSASPLKNFTSGMVVYNTSSSNDLTPGLYYSDGTKWIKGNTTISNTGFLIGAQSYLETVATSNQSIFKTPATITDVNKIFLYRNGIMISFSINNSTSIKSELPCNQGDQIRIIQLL